MVLQKNAPHHGLVRYYTQSLKRHLVAHTNIQNTLIQQVTHSTFSPQSTALFDQLRTYVLSSSNTDMEIQLDRVLFTTQTFSSVISPVSGIIQYAGPVFGMRNTVLVQSDQKYIFSFGNLESMQVHKGQTVNAGEILGELSPHTAEDNAFVDMRIFRKTQVILPKHWHNAYFPFIKNK